MSYKIVISKPGVDAGTATNANDLIFSSDYNTLKYALSGTYLMTTNTTTVATISHNLGYTPFFISFVNQFDTSVPGQYGMVEYFDTQSPLRACRAYVDTTNIYFSYNTSDATTYNIIWYYKIFKNNMGL
ncbi:MAG: hypothetical protein ACYC6W_11775 [Nitrosotalea sp.]